MTILRLTFLAAAFVLLASMSRSVADGPSSYFDQPNDVSLVSAGETK